MIPVTKNGKPRTIPLSTRAIKAIKDQLQIFSDPNVIPIERDPLVFTFSLRMFRRTFDSIREKLNMKDWKPHDMRHEATSRLFEKGFSIVEVASITGHEDLILNLDALNSPRYARTIYSIEQRPMGVGTPS